MAPVKKTASRHLLPAFFCLLLAACGAAPDPVELSGATMGTSYHITWLAGEEGPSPEAVHLAVESLLEGINASMSTYRQDSEITAVNRAPVGEWVRVRPEFVEVFRWARAVGEASAGAYDVTVAPLVDLWGFGPGGGSEIPADAAIAAAMAEVGQQWLELDVAAGRVRKTRPLSLDFSSIAKGYGVDKIAEWLSSRDIGNYLVEIGGEIRVGGHSPRGTPWRIAVEKPSPGVRQVLATLALRDAAVATSGDYRNFFEVDGERYSHSIDPRTGRPVRHQLVSVSVVHEQAALADAWATALIVLGTEQALATATREGLAAYLISESDEGLTVAASPAMLRWIE